LVELVAIIFGTFGWLAEIWNIFLDVVWPCTYEKDVKGQRVLLVGSGDIGLELAKGLADRGAIIAFWDYDQKTLDDIKRDFPKIGGKEVITQRVDITKMEQIQEAANKLWNEHNYEVDILLNSAGIAHVSDCFDEPIEHINRIIDVNVKGVIYTIRTFLPKFYKRKHGHIITVSSIAGTMGCPHVCEYSASKHAVVGYMDSIAVDALARGLNELEFTTLCPCFIQTKMIADTKYTGTPKWPLSQTDESCRSLLKGILQNKRHIIFPWKAKLIVSFKYLLSVRHMNQLLARQWPY